MRIKPKRELLDFHAFYLFLQASLVRRFASLKHIRLFAVVAISLDEPSDSGYLQ